MLEVLDLDPSRFDLSMIGFIVTRRTFDRPRRRPLAFDRPRLDVAPWPSTTLVMASPNLRHCSLAFIVVFVGEALTTLALVMTFFNREGSRRLWRR
ncbi:hypothetical protein Acr_09g0009410 [Actinidia rufa]|uniref:Uncharacterized protein n=1 Tax=Actinidia rufa TaxID=165716 RepID=A0A7J0F736_9ERIC|nr:hypothetical protein Acr_09g0009410 [Actinidia rufa]